jgi:hypothetical protein
VNAATKKLLERAEAAVLERIELGKVQYKQAIKGGKTPTEAVTTVIFNLGVDTARAALDLPAPRTRQTFITSWARCERQASEMLARKTGASS